MENIIFYGLVLLCIILLFVVGYTYNRINKNKIKIIGLYSASCYLKKQNDELTNEIKKLKIENDNGWNIVGKHANTIGTLQEKLDKQTELLIESDKSNQIKQELIDKQSDNLILLNHQISERKKISELLRSEYNLLDETNNKQIVQIQSCEKTIKDQQSQIESLIEQKKEMSEEIGFKQEKIERLEKENAKPKHKKQS